MRALRRALTVGAAILISAAALLATRPEMAAAGPCKGSTYVSKCNLAAKKAPTKATKTSSKGKGGGSHLYAPRSGGGGAKSGPSKLQIARKAEKAIQRDWARYVKADKAYRKCAQTGRGGCFRPAVSGAAKLTGASVMLTGQPRPAGAPRAPQITPGQAGAIAVARLQLPVSAPGIGPDPKVNEWKMAAIGYPLWLWADGPTHIGPVGQNVGGLSVSLDATVSKTVFRMGDGKSVTCRGGGTPYAKWVQPGAKSPTCGYTYHKPSLPNKKYTVTATTYWDVRWTVNGVSGVQTVPMVGTRQLPVGELQAVIIR